MVPKAVRRPVDGRKIENARRFIQKSAGNMKALLLDPLLNQARLEDFPMVERPSLCRRCNFRRLCFPRSARDDGKHEARGVGGVVQDALLRP